MDNKEINLEKIYREAEDWSWHGGALVCSHVLSGGTSGPVIGGKLFEYLSTWLIFCEFAVSLWLVTWEFYLNEFKTF